jgi:hypothetical protein
MITLYYIGIDNLGVKAFMTDNELLRALAAYYGANYSIGEADAGDLPLAAAYILDSADDKYTLIRRAVVGRVESFDYVYIFVADALTSDLAKRCLAFALSDGGAHINPTGDHAFSFITALFFSAEADAAAKAAVKRARMHREYSSPQTGWSELRSAAFGMDGVTLACNPMGRDVAAAIRKALA